MLSGAAALIVEDEYFIALEVQGILQSAGADPVLIVRDPIDAAAHDGGSKTDLALVSVGPDGGSAIEFCIALVARGVAVVLLASDRRYENPTPGLYGVRVLHKPFTSDELLVAATAALKAAAG